MHTYRGLWRHRRAGQQPGPLQILVNLSLAPNPIPRCVCLRPDSTTTQALAAGPHSGVCHTICSSYYCCLPWFLATRPRGDTEDPNNPCSHWRSLAVFTKHCTVVNKVDPSSLSPLSLPKNPVLLHTLTSQGQIWGRLFLCRPHQILPSFSLRDGLYTILQIQYYTIVL